ncbi:GMC family oxidoreductase [Pseudorhodoplanes sinuspersici]|nr:GMC family oxidoreductase N-terminal domain-containing protein [Pseudorhodoplanes sinuspersici]RKE70599.1 choline dehydrogenase-like flavoprotein [Pseudorhodoplanes sinuspersici]
MSVATSQAGENRYDYVIVGGGSAGCVLAARLSENPDIRVCLIEAGPRDRNPLIHIPLGVMRLINHPRLNWRYWSTPQQHAADRPIYLPRGRVLGGSSSINGSIYMRGHRADYDDWAKWGNPGWSYADVLPYFRKSENNEQFQDSPYHGRGGPMNVTDLESYNPLVDIMCEAAESLQLARTADFNGKEQEGFGRRQVTVRRGRRESAATAFLRNARSRPNLTIICNALVSRIVFENRRATRVEFKQDDKPRSLSAKREIVLAAGAFASPAILMRSGIGNGPALQELGIGVLHHAPQVGSNLQDHISAAVQYSSPTTMPYGLSLRSMPWLAWSFLQYPLFRRGLLANTILHAGGFVKSRPDLDRPDIQFILLPAERTPEGRVGIGHGYGLVTLLLRPRSSGIVTLAGRDPDRAPVIDPRFYSEMEDLDDMVRGLRFARRVLEAPAWQHVRGEELRPGPSVQSDEALKDYIRATSVTCFHPVGTCRMGPDANDVVDAQLRVRGVEGLRVVDASIMPRMIGGNTNAPVIMIAEKAADMISGRPPLPAATGL